MSIKIDPADKWFSLYIRERDNWTCKRCGRKYDRDIPNQLQNSHFYGRANESTRFDPENCDSVCYGCHNYWENTNHESYREFKINQLGKKRFDLLTLRRSQYKRKDRKMEAIIWREAYRQLCKEKGVEPRK